MMPTPVMLVAMFGAWMFAFGAVLEQDPFAPKSGENGGPPRVGWWWVAPATASDPQVDALLSFVKENKIVVTSVMMRCGPTTESGAISGAMLPSCVRVIPALIEMVM